MEPTQRSLIRKTFIEGAALGGLTYFALSSRFANVLPDLSKKGLKPPKTSEDVPLLEGD